MSNFDENFKKILESLNKNIKNEEDLETAKVEVFNLYNMFFDEITELEQTMNKKILAIAESQLHVEEEIRNINKSLKSIEKDIYMEEDDTLEDDDEIEVKCPYCNGVFRVLENDLSKNEITCPKCNNEIELDWGEDECGCGGNCDDEDDCDCCSHDCDCKHDEE